jgi:hypothetical protein
MACGPYRGFCLRQQPIFSLTMIALLSCKPVFGKASLAIDAREAPQEPGGCAMPGPSPERHTPVSHLSQR